MYDLIRANGVLVILQGDEVIATFTDRLAAYEELARLNANSWVYAGYRS